MTNVPGFEGLPEDYEIQAIPVRIELPEDSNLVTRLAAKLKEYDTRADEYPEPDGYKAGDHPWVVSGRDARYKSIILGTVLTRGYVDAKDFYDEVQGLHFDQFTADEAMRVIGDYCLTGGRTNQGGSLPSLEDAQAVLAEA